MLASGKVLDEWQFFIPIDNVLNANQFGRSRHRINNVQSPATGTNDYDNEDDGDEDMAYPLDVEVSRFYLYHIDYDNIRNFFFSR